MTRLSEREAVDFCLYEIPDPKPQAPSAADHDLPANNDEEAHEGSPLLPQLVARVRRSSTEPAGSSIKRYQLLSSLSRLTMSLHGDVDDQEEDGTDPTAPFKSLNALEIAAVADAKRFLSQHIVQKIITGIWNGDIIFWDALSVKAEKKPRFYNARTADPYSRLRVPRYLKTWEVLFFAVFLCLYYAVLGERNIQRITPTEIVLYIWLAAFCYDELSEWIDAGSIFYAADIWNAFDIIMIGIGFAFATLRIIGIVNDDPWVTDLAFNVFSLEALFMIPRICSFLSLSPYWGTLIPCLREMAKDFVKFMILVVIIYLGFLTTFSLIGQKTFALPVMAMNLTKIFFGSSYVGFDIMSDIDPVFGPTLMIIFVTFSSILLMGSLTGMLSNSFSRVITHAREEYLYVYSVYVLEASTSNRLTHFYPPFNLVALVIFRPLRLVLPRDDKFRAGRIILLRATHLPIVGAIQLYELIRRRVLPDEFAGFKGPRSTPSGMARYRLKYGSERRVSTVRPALHMRASTQAHEHEDEGMEGPTPVEMRVAELSDKIEKLTALVEALQGPRAPEKK